MKKTVGTLSLALALALALLLSTHAHADIPSGAKYWVDPSAPGAPSGSTNYSGTIFSIQTYA